MAQHRHRLARAARLVRLGAVVCLCAAAWAQTVTSEWRRVGTLTLAQGLASPAAAGAVERVVFTPDGELAVTLASGRVWVSADGESWRAASTAPAQSAARAERLPESSAVVRESATGPARLYAAGADVWRSDDAGRNWTNLTHTSSGSLLGARATDVAVDPRNADRIAVASSTGVWISIDAGLSWQGWNEALPAFRAARILAAPQRGRGVQVALASGAVEWAPGFRLGWMRVARADEDAIAAERFSRILQTNITVAADVAGVRYAATADGRLWSTLDATSTDASAWRAASLTAGLGAARRIVADPNDGRFAIALFQSKTPHVLRTFDGGATWDDITANLGDASVNGAAFDRATGYIYLATSTGVFFSMQGARAAEPAQWRALRGLPDASVNDIRVDEPGTRLLCAVDGYGIYETAAPHRARMPLVLHAADYGARAASPGATLAIVGATVESVTANSSRASLLSATASEAQIQLPYDVTGDTVRLIAYRASAAPLVFGMALRATSPAVLIDGEGFPVVIDADTGIQVDALNPVRPGARLQVLASGLGRVKPDWPAGAAAPQLHPPEVVATVRVTLDGAPVKVLRATLAPGYVGYYLVEFEAPAALNAGQAELTVEAAGQSSNVVRVFTVAD